VPWRHQEVGRWHLPTRPTKMPTSPLGIAPTQGCGRLAAAGTRVTSPNQESGYEGRRRRCPPSPRVPSRHSRPRVLLTLICHDDDQVFGRFGNMAQCLRPWDSERAAATGHIIRHICTSLVFRISLSESDRQHDFRFLVEVAGIDLCVLYTISSEPPIRSRNYHQG
jgi:hypothetical protein